MTDQFFRDDRHIRRSSPFVMLFTSQVTFGVVFGRAAVHFALEVLEDFGATVSATSRPRSSLSFRSSGRADPGSFGYGFAFDSSYVSTLELAAPRGIAVRPRSFIVRC